MGSWDVQGLERGVTGSCEKLSVQSRGGWVGGWGRGGRCRWVEVDGVTNRDHAETFGLYPESTGI